MSYQNFERALDLAKQCEGYDIGGGKSDEAISAASKLLSITFSKQNYKYFRELGYLEFFGVEIFGIVIDDFSGDLRQIA